MTPDQVRFMYDYDRWATRRVLDQLDGLDPEVWARENVVDERGLGGVLVHQFGAAQRWRTGSQQFDETPRPEMEPLLSVEELRRRWEAEWEVTDAWLPTLTQSFIEYVHEGVPVWQMLLHVMNHGTQHRSEAAALLSAEGRSPGEIDIIFYAEDLAAQAGPGPSGEQ